MKHRFPRNDAQWAIIVQFLFVVVLFPGVWGTYHLKAASAFFAGALICILPNIYFYLRVFSHHGARAAKRILHAFYWGEAVKYCLTGAGFLITLQWFQPVWVFIGYIAAQLGFWLAPIALSMQNKMVRRDERGK